MKQQTFGQLIIYILFGHLLLKVLLSPSCPRAVISLWTAGVKYFINPAPVHRILITLDSVGGGGGGGGV